MLYVKVSSPEVSDSYNEWGFFVLQPYFGKEPHRQKRDAAPPYRGPREQKATNVQVPHA